MAATVVVGGRGLAYLVERLIAESMGWLHGYYARAAVESGVALALLAYEDGELVGAEVAYRVGMGRLSLGVHYYVVVAEPYRSKGVGRMLVASAEEVLGSVSAYAASTSRGNTASRRLFKSMCYREFSWGELEDLVGQDGVYELLAALCGYEDDVVYLKPCTTSLEELFNSLRRGAKASRRVWKRVCLDPWYALWRTPRP